MKSFSKSKKILLALGVLSVALLLLSFLPERQNRFKTDHFTFIFSSSIDSSLIYHLAGALEINYGRISQDLRTAPAPRIEVYVYAHRWRYIQATGRWTTTGSIEGTSRLHFVTRDWTDFEHKKVVVHEFTHAVVLKLLLDREPRPVDLVAFNRKFAAFPTWLWEAVGVFEAQQLVEPKTLPYLTGDSFPSLAELNKRHEGSKIYDVGYTIIEYMLKQYGPEKSLELVAHYGNIPEVLGIPEETFFKGWHDFVKEKYLQ